MAERSDITTDWSESPRLIEVADPSTSILVQDLHDTCRSDTKQPGEGGDNLHNMDDDFIIDSAGKESLGGGIEVGITATLQNAQVAFESRLTPTSIGTVTTANGAGTNLIDASATFVTDGVERGAYVVNFTDESVTEVLEVLSQTELRTRVLRAGTDNDYDLADAYKVWNVIQCNIAGGNLVAVDDVAAELNPVFPTFATQIVRTASSSATLANQELQQFGGAVWVDSVDGVAGTEFPIGTETNPVDNVADALLIAANRNLKRFQVRGTLTFASDPDPSEWDGFGGGAGMVLQAGADLTNTFWSDVQFSGAVSGSFGMSAAGLQVLIRNAGFTSDTFTDLHGTFTECLFDSTTLRPVLAPLVVVDCASQTAGSSPGLTIDGTAGAIDVSVRRFSGGVQVQNVTAAGAVMTVELTAGKITLDSSCTAGTIVCRGVGLLVDNSNGATVVNELVDPVKLKEVHTVLGLEEGNKVTITPSGVDTELGDIDVDFTGDGINTTTMDRQP